MQKELFDRIVEKRVSSGTDAGQNREWANTTFLDMRGAAKDFAASPDGLALSLVVYEEYNLFKVAYKAAIPGLEFANGGVLFKVSNLGDQIEIYKTGQRGAQKFVRQNAKIVSSISWWGLSRNPPPSPLARPKTW